MAESDKDLEKYLGQNVDSVQKQLESQGYKVHLVTLGRFATGCVMKSPQVYGAKPEKHVSISFNGDDPERKVVYIEEIDD